MNLLQRIIGWPQKSRRKGKEDWEFDWQRTEWCSLYQNPETKEKVLEYWNNFRHLNDIRRHVAITGDTRILDVGCGISTVLHYLPGRRYGIDPLAERYKSIYEYPKEIEIRSGYGEAIPFTDGYFDIVISSNCIDHTENPVKTMGEMRRVLKPGGHVLLTCEVFNASLGERNAGHPHSLTLHELETLTNGFETVEKWDSPWYGLQNYVLGRPATSQREHIFLLKKPSRTER